MSRNFGFDEEMRREPVPSTSFRSGDLAPLPPYSIAIFDTCALMQDAQILDVTVRSNVVVVIPNMVLRELDGLKKGANTRKAATEALHAILKLLEEGNRLFFLESSHVMEERMRGIDMTDGDDKILKCALRVHQHMSYQERSVMFVSNDIALRLKTCAWSTPIIAIESQNFVESLQGENRMNEAGNLLNTLDLDQLRTCLTVCLTGINHQPNDQGWIPRDRNDNRVVVENKHENRQKEENVVRFDRQRMNEMGKEGRKRTETDETRARRREERRVAFEQEQRDMEEAMRRSIEEQSGARQTERVKEDMTIKKTTQRSEQDRITPLAEMEETLRRYEEESRRTFAMPNKKLQVALEDDAYEMAIRMSKEGMERDVPSTNTPPTAPDIQLNEEEEMEEAIRRSLLEQNGLQSYVTPSHSGGMNSVDDRMRRPFTEPIPDQTEEELLEMALSMSMEGMTVTVPETMSEAQEMRMKREAFLKRFD